jgi:hypothetical protein
MADETTITNDGEPPGTQGTMSFTPDPTKATSLVIKAGTTKLNKTFTIVLSSAPVIDASPNGYLMVTEFFKHAHDVDTSVTILPLTADDTTAPTIHTAKDFPSGKDGFDKYCKYEYYAPPNSGKGKKHCIYVSITAQEAFGSLKQKLMPYLQAQKLHMRLHNWTSQKISAIGFIHGIHPRICYRDDVSRQIKDALALVIKDTTVPNFKLTFVKKGFGNGESRIVTEVLEIHCESDDAPALKDAFMHDTYAAAVVHKFIPEGTLQTTSEAVYKKILSEQNRFLDSIMTIPITGLHASAIELPVTISGITCNIGKSITEGHDQSKTKFKIVMNPTSHTGTEGRWLISFPKVHINEVRNHLDDFFNTVYPQAIEEHPDELSKLPNAGFQNPQRTNRPAASPTMSAWTSKLMIAFAGDDDDTGPQKPPENPRKRTRDTTITFDSGSFPRLVTGTPAAPNVIPPTLTAAPTPAPGISRIDIQTMINDAITAAAQTTETRLERLQTMLEQSQRESQQNFTTMMAMFQSLSPQQNQSQPPHHQQHQQQHHQQQQQQQHTGSYTHHANMYPPQYVNNPYTQQYQESHDYPQEAQNDQNSAASPMNTGGDGQEN